MLNDYSNDFFVIKIPEAFYDDFILNVLPAGSFIKLKDYDGKVEVMISIEFIDIVYNENIPDFQRIM